MNALPTFEERCAAFEVTKGRPPNDLDKMSLQQEAHTEAVLLLIERVDQLLDTLGTQTGG